MTPEAAARANIDRALADAGWVVQDVKAMNIAAGCGVAVREFPLVAGHGYADYLLYVDGRVAGVIEAKKEGTPLTGVETRFTNRLDPTPKSRDVFTFHRPETLAEWAQAEPLWMPVVDGKPHPLSQRPASFRGRLTAMPPVPEGISTSSPTTPLAHARRA
jgi:type I restriction enzyme, R subunit